MKKSRFTEEQVIGILREQESGTATPQARISSATVYKWKAKYGGLEVPDAKRLKGTHPVTAALSSKARC